MLLLFCLLWSPQHQLLRSIFTEHRMSSFFYPFFSLHTAAVYFMSSEDCLHTEMRIDPDLYPLEIEGMVLNKSYLKLI